jgi:hypothetical protein
VLFRNLRFFLIVFLSALFSACAYQSPVVTNPGFDMKTVKTNHGYVALSTKCVGTNRAIFLYYGRVGATFWNSKGEDPLNDMFSIRCNVGYPEFYLLKIHPGKFKFESIAPAYTVEQKHHYIYFNVRPNAVTYIGRLYLYEKEGNKKSFLTKLLDDSQDARYDRNVEYQEVRLVNMANKDIPYFVKKFKNIPRYKYKVEIASLRK